MKAAKLALSTLFAAMTFAACFGGDGDGSNNRDASAPDAAPACNAFDVTALPTTTATRADVDAVFRLSCSFSTCHGSNPGAGALYLPKVEDGDWYDQVVNKRSAHLPGMMRVAPGDPNNSFLLIKMDGRGLCYLATVGVSVDAGMMADAMPSDAMANDAGADADAAASNDAGNDAEAGASRDAGADAIAVASPKCNGDAGSGLSNASPCGDTMPQGGDRLPDQDIAKVAAWIRAGAPKK